MQKRLRDLLRTVVTDLRHTLTGGPNGQRDPGVARGDLDRELERLGVAPDGTVTPFDALPNPTAVERKARRATEAQLSAASAANRATVRNEIVERAAYTWINRLLALRAMEARGLNNPVLRADPAYDGLSEALFVLRQTNPQAASGPDAGWWTVIEDACREQAASLPGLFDLLDPSASLRPSTPALLRCAALMGNPPAGYTAEEADAAFADPDAIGWAYQFYQEEAKARTYAKLNAGGKAATRAEIASVTQLFTEPYMVKWLLQNSLGRTYHELYPDSRLPETWEYYIRDLPKDGTDDDRRPPIDAAAAGDLDGLTFMDPCMGSGHFEREAFDMLAAMYREQRPGLTATEIADRVLSRHLHGIDLDPRAAQLAALTLYLRAWELVAEERRSRRLPGPGTYRPPAMNLATTPTGLTPGSLERHLQRHPEDRVYRPLLEGIFAALEQADVLGSLLRPGEQLDAAIRAFRARADGQMQLVSEDADLNRLLAELAQHDPAELKRVLLDRVARSFAVEATDNDIPAALFGREAEEGLRLLQLLDRKYGIVVTNPPYMGSASMCDDLRCYIESYYRAGRRDVYAAFILRSISMCSPSGRLAMVTQQTWMFLRSFADLRSASVVAPDSAGQEAEPTGLLHERTIEAVVHLGAYAFEEISGAVVQGVLFVLAVRSPSRTHALRALRLVGARDPSEKRTLLLKAARAGISDSWFVPLQSQLAQIPTAPLCYWLPQPLLALLQTTSRLSTLLTVKKGLDTADNSRFMRLYWEVKELDERWRLSPKGGGFGRWVGQNSFLVDWQLGGARIKRLGKGTPRNEHHYGRSGATYTEFGQGCLGVRTLPAGSIFNTSSPGLFFFDYQGQQEALAILNCRISSFLLRVFQPSIQHLGEGYVPLLPVPSNALEAGTDRLVEAILDLKQQSVNRRLDEWTFDVSDSARRSATRDTMMSQSAVLHALESLLESLVFQAYDLDNESTQSVLDETGVPSGWYPLVAGYDVVPDLELDLVSRPALQGLLVVGLAERERLHPGNDELNRIKAKLRTLYAPGPGIQVDANIQELRNLDDDEEGALNALIPIPPGSFLEDLSQKLQIHPISVYWLLQELRAEGVRCKPEELRLLEDRLSVLVLRLLGHRWQRQIEAGEPVPPWADPDGIIPLTPTAGETSLAERLRDRLRDEDGDRGSQQVEALLLELTGLTLEEWLRRTFFSRHVRQFKHRPIAWHLASTTSKDGPRRGKVKREPAFQCLLYYHACRGDVLARLRAHYVEPLIRLETAAVADARRRGDETATAIAVSRVHELEEFADRLRGVAEEGFACAELDRLLEGEPLDRWSGDGIVAPASAEGLATEERAWRVDINDGVRVNIAPLQLASLLASEVLRPDDARKAIADRARWRSDERRWVREGVLPRCGWMDEDVPESLRWTERTPEREAEARKLEEKRRPVMEKLA